MIYALEILFAFVLFLAAFATYHVLLNSRAFRRVIERTFQPRHDAIDIESVLEDARAEASQFVNLTEDELKRKAAALRRVRKLHPQT